jgi:hypothetical protein
MRRMASFMADVISGYNVALQSARSSKKVSNLSIRVQPERPCHEPDTPRGANPMKVMVFVKATPNSEAETLFKEPEKLAQMFAEMGRYNEELVKAGIMKGGDGPFTETKELIAGFWIWEVKSMEEAVEWAKKCPNPMPGEVSDLEIRPYYEAADFGAGFTPEEQVREADLRKRIGDA